MAPWTGERTKPTLRNEIRRWLAAIPYGHVATYGQIAAVAGNPRAARQVAWVLRHNDSGLPWHRVINAQGGISLPAGAGLERQRALLENEGVAVGPGNRVDLDRYQWRSLAAGG